MMLLWTIANLFQSIQRSFSSVKQHWHTLNAQVVMDALIELFVCTAVAKSSKISSREDIALIP
jgi:hypothetical protein